MKLQTRCFLTSAAVHAAILLLLLLAPGFRRPLKDLSGPPLELIPGELIDIALAPGFISAPAPALPAEPMPAQPEPEVPREPETPPQPTVRNQPPPPREQRAPEVERVPETPKPEVPTQPKPGKAPKPDPQPRFDFSKAKRITPAKSTAKASKQQSAENQERAARRAMERRLAEAAGAISANRDTSTIRISAAGGGGGGRGSANAWSVRNAYDAAWVTPLNVTDELATTEVEVVIRGDGTVKEAKIIRRSGIAALDRSVEDALRKVQRITPFETFSSEETVAFTIGFNLKSRGQL